MATITSSYPPFLPIVLATENLRDPPAPSRVSAVTGVVFWPVAGAVVCTLSIAVRVFRLMIGAHFWLPKDPGYTFKARLWDATKDVGRILATPLAYIGIEAGYMVGVIAPHQGLAFVSMIVSRVTS
jgi:hypothetical protein